MLVSQDRLIIRCEKVRLPGGQQLHVQFMQNPEAAAGQPVLVFLHEALGSVAMWKDVPRQIAEKSGCNALVYDRLGHGGSGPLSEELAGIDYLFRESWENLPAVLDACRIGQAVLIGHSDGGTIALMAAAKFPQRIKAVIAEAAHVLVEEETLRGIRAVVESSQVAELKARLGRYHQQDIEPIFNRWPRVWLSEAFANWNIESLLTDVLCPLLVIQGEEDEFATRGQVEAIARGVSGRAETLLIENCRHIPHFQTAEIFCDATLDFLRRQVLADCC